MSRENGSGDVTVTFSEINANPEDETITSSFYFYISAGQNGGGVAYDTLTGVRAVALITLALYKDANAAHFPSVACESYNYETLGGEEQI